MTFDEWLALIRDVAHTGDEQATLRLAWELMSKPRRQDCWREVCAYARCLDLDKIARVMADHGWYRSGRRVCATGHRPAIRLSPARYLAAWSDEVPRTGKDYSWWWQVDSGRATPSDFSAYHDLKEHLEARGKWTGDTWMQVLNRVQHRALVQYLRARLWMEP